MNLLFLDVDGVLTDGKVYVTHEGNRFKAFSARDNRAIAEFVAHGWEVHIVTTSRWPGLSGFIDSTKAFIHEGINKSAAELQCLTQGKPYAAVGDDVFDLEMLNHATDAYIPADADPVLFSRGDFTKLQTRGGAGVVAELARILL